MAGRLSHCLPQQVTPSCLFLLLSRGPGTPFISKHLSPVVKKKTFLGPYAMSFYLG